VARSATRSRGGAADALAAAVALLAPAVRADTTLLEVLDPNPQVSTFVGAGIKPPIGIVFLGADDYLLLEKASGQVKRAGNGLLQASPVLELTVNSNSERDLLSMALHPNFSNEPYVYIAWTESSTGADTNVVLNVPPRGNRVDRFVGNGTTLTQDVNVVRLRSLQTDNVRVPEQPGMNTVNPNGERGGGTIRSGPYGKLYVFIGDQCRRGWMQNRTNGPFVVAPFVDDTFGGPASDNAPLSGVMLRLNAEGTAPVESPFSAAGAAIAGEVGANVQTIYSSGRRSGFGVSFDPASGFPWLTENAGDAYAELNRLVPGVSGGWIQFAGPASRMLEWRSIETTQFGQALQRVRYPPTRAVHTTSAALSRLVMLPGADHNEGARRRQRPRPGRWRDIDPPVAAGRHGRADARVRQRGERSAGHARTFCGAALPAALRRSARRAGTPVRPVEAQTIGPCEGRAGIRRSRPQTGGRGARTGRPSRLRYRGARACTRVPRALSGPDRHPGTPRVRVRVPARRAPGPVQRAAGCRRAETPAVAAVHQPCQRRAPARVARVKGISAQRLRFDSNAMGCPFDLRLHYRCPQLDNAVGQVGADATLHAASSFDGWLAPNSTCRRGCSTPYREPPRICTRRASRSASYRGRAGLAGRHQRIDSRPSASGGGGTDSAGGSGAR
jgi:glucose/arabinose dehydrogenase